MKSAVTSRIFPASGNCISSYWASVEPADIRFSVASSTASSATSKASAVVVSTGPIWLAMDPETARCLGEQMIAAADHYDQQTAIAARPA